METLQAIVSFAMIGGGILLMLIGLRSSRKKPPVGEKLFGIEAAVWARMTQLESENANLKADLDWERKSRKDLTTEVLDAFHGGPKVGDDTDGCEHWDWTAEHIRSRIDAAKADHALGLLARVRDLEKAIEPFASYGRRCPARVPDDHECSAYTWFDPNIPNPTVGDARKAAAAKDKRG